MNTWETVWTFKTQKYSVSLAVTPCENSIDWCEPEEKREIENRIERGLLVYFDSKVQVKTRDGTVIGADYLGSCLYESVHEFLTSHRDPDPMNRNSSIMRARRGNVSICHYFPGMVSEAINNARQTARAVSALAR